MNACIPGPKLLLRSEARQRYLKTSMYGWPYPELSLKLILVEY